MDSLTDGKLAYYDMTNVGDSSTCVIEVHSSVRYAINHPIN